MYQRPPTATHATDVARCNPKSTSCNSSNYYAGLIPIYALFSFAGALDSDDSDFVASGSTRTLIRQSRNTIKGLTTHLSHGQTAQAPGELFSLSFSLFLLTVFLDTTD
jgi:hypothetical protein